LKKIEIVMVSIIEEEEILEEEVMPILEEEDVAISINGETIILGPLIMEEVMANFIKILILIAFIVGSLTTKQQIVDSRDMLRLQKTSSKILVRIWTTHKVYF